MRILLHEYVSHELPAAAWKDSSLRFEGWAMFSALRQDLSRIAGVDVFSLSQFNEIAFRASVRAADYTVVIAPEFDNILLDRCRWIQEEGGRSLGSSLTAVQLAGDKLALSRHLRDRSVPTPDSYPGPPSDPPAHLSYPLVWKPRFGAGSTATFLICHADEWASCVAQARAESWGGESLVQPFVPGMPVSVAFLTGRRQQMSLPAASQRLSTDGRFRYRGGDLPLPTELDQRARRLASRALATISGWCGYVGVDLILGAADDGSQDWVIEINPRWTTSYIGLRALATTNLAEVLLHIAMGDQVLSPNWRSGGVGFTSDGHVCETFPADRLSMTRFE